MIFGVPFEGIPGRYAQPQGFPEDVAPDISRAGDVRVRDELTLPLLRGAGEGARPVTTWSDRSAMLRDGRRAIAATRRVQSVATSRRASAVLACCKQPQERGSA